jgi:hypothetical protein
MRLILCALEWNVRRLADTFAQFPGLQVTTYSFCSFFYINYLNNSNFNNKNDKIKILRI